MPSELIDVWARIFSEDLIQLVARKQQMKFEPTAVAADETGGSRIYVAAFCDH
jgi:hypothetical protein